MNDYYGLGYESGFKEGYAEGQFIGFLEIGLKYLKDNNTDYANKMDKLNDLVDKGAYTEFERQQLLYYSRAGIYKYKKGGMKK